jgi:hypothetical protein
MKTEVSNLETGWNEAYGQTVEKLKKLKGELVCQSLE